MTTTKRTMIGLIVSMLMLGSAIAYGAETKPPTTDSKPVATCNDGRTMYGPNPAAHMGACRGHGGVKSWADGSPVKRKGTTRTYR